MSAVNFSESFSEAKKERTRGPAPGLRILKLRARGVGWEGVAYLAGLDVNDFAGGDSHDVFGD